MHAIKNGNFPKGCGLAGHGVMETHALRIHDLIAKTAHVSLKNTVRVLLALRAVAKGSLLSADEILVAPYQTSRPSPEATQHCEEAYLWLYDDEEVAKTLFEIEQLR